tara:strand:+ start:211 stop:369 length:159 start_codon:yes stop_codon:yes gene_type:complete
MRCGDYYSAFKIAAVGALLTPIVLTKMSAIFSFSLVNSFVKNRRNKRPKPSY